ncbi:MAG: Prepilin peptidase [Acidimicrobiaceae bacterium]|nr:Prepilin peptidase [Acidimicrobiaceae bacterium]
MLAILIAASALFGLCVGSFLNVVIHRVPLHESVVSPRSHCPFCKSPIRDRDNIPVLSWLLLRGRCRDCHSPISPRYMMVEIASGALFAGAAARLGFNWDLPAFLVLLAGLLTLACIDLERLILPKSIVYATTALVISLLLLDAGVTGQWHRFLVAAISSAAWFVLFYLMNLASPRILGFGDVRLALPLGFGLGWLGWRYVVLGFFASNLIGLIIGVSLIAAKKIRRDQPVPYGVFLALGAALAIYAGPEILRPLQNLR